MQTKPFFWKFNLDWIGIRQLCTPHLSTCCNAYVRAENFPHLRIYNSDEKMVWHKKIGWATDCPDATTFFNFFLSPIPTLVFTGGSPLLMDPHPSQQHAGLHHVGLHHAVWQLQLEVTRPKARFKPTSSEKCGLDGVANQVPTYLGQLVHRLQRWQFIWQIFYKIALQFVAIWIIRFVKIIAAIREKDFESWRRKQDAQLVTLCWASKSVESDQKRLGNIIDLHY